MAQRGSFEHEGRSVLFTDQGLGPVVVLVPERGSGDNALSTLQAVLVEEGLRAVRVATGTAPEGTDAAADIAAAVAVVAEVMDRVDLRRAWIGGHGFGGSVAAAFAATYPDRADGVLFLSVADVDAPLPDGTPVLIVQGADDQVTPPSRGEQLAARAAGRASIETIDGGGHLFPMTHPLETAEAVEGYLGLD